MAVVLIDGDVVAYKCSASIERAVEWDTGYWTWFCDPEEVKRAVEDEIDSYTASLFADSIVVALTDDVHNFRKDILPTYKSNRANTKRPLVLKEIRRWMCEKYEVFQRPNLEGDDVLGILATWPKFRRERGASIIVSVDKDMKTVPGLYCRSLREGVIELPAAEAAWYHMYQTLTGDATDGYAGCPGVGPKKAADILDLATDKDADGRVVRFDEVEGWAAVVAAFTKAKLGEEEALTQARVARILRYEDYDFKNAKPILWSPQK